MTLSRKPLEFMSAEGKSALYELEHNECPKCNEITFSPEQLKAVSAIRKAS